MPVTVGTSAIGPIAVRWHQDGATWLVDGNLHTRLDGFLWQG